MPVGNSDKGVGLWTGQIMVSLDNNYQFINWGHAEIDGETADFEEGDGNHLGTLSSKIIAPGITIGLSDYWNITINQIIGVRSMTWGKDWVSMHHREEDSSSNFDNAEGGIIGDTRITIRYLFLNDGAGPGKRLFFGLGLIKPSKNTLTSDPFFLNQDEVEPHRHFSISEGVYKLVFETQYFIKRKFNPVFLGGTISIEQSLNESQYGYKASGIIDLSFTALSNKIKYINSSIGLNLIFRNTSLAYWNNIPAPNSESIFLIPGIGFVRNTKIGTIALNLYKPYFLKGAISGLETNIKEETDFYQVSLSMRRILNYSIPFLDY